MAVTKLFKSPSVLSQTPDDDCNVPEPAIAVSHDESPILVIAQEGQEIMLNLNSVNEFCRLLKSTRDQALAWQKAKELKP